jgi:hypothetical protein
MVEIASRTGYDSFLLFVGDSPLSHGRIQPLFIFRQPDSMRITLGNQTSSTAQSLFKAGRQSSSKEEFCLIQQFSWCNKVLTHRPFEPGVLVFNP